MNISPARAAAFDILLRIETERAFSSVLLPIFEENLSPLDGSLCHELTLGTLRRQIYLDRVIDAFAGGRKLDVEVRIALRLGLYQLFYLTKIPPYSAINESVNLVARAKKTSAKAFVNAILRGASRETPKLSYVDLIDQISVETSHPKWLVEKWAGEFGEDEAKLIAVINNEIPASAFRVTGELSDADRLFIENARPSVNVAGCLIADRSEKLFALAKEGKIYLQDEASQMAAQVVEITPDGRFLDVCAAPGGKTGLIAKRDSKSAKLIVAGDLHLSRAAFLRENCGRQGIDFVQVLQYNAERALPFVDGSFDNILVDAPCSGTGTIRANPELRYFLKPEDFDDLSAKQLSILKNASKLLRSGGTLVYSTCSIEMEENEGVCKRFVSANADFQKVEPNVPNGFITGAGFARTWPHRDGMDGFFIASFRRE